MPTNAKKRSNFGRKKVPRFLADEALADFEWAGVTVTPPAVECAGCGCFVDADEPARRRRKDAPRQQNKKTTGTKKQKGNGTRFDVDGRRDGQVHVLLQVLLLLLLLLLLLRQNLRLADLLQQHQLHLLGAQLGLQPPDQQLALQLLLGAPLLCAPNNKK